MVTFVMRVLAISMCGLLFLSQLSFAAIPKNLLKGEGVIRGGQAGTGFSILDVRRTQTQKVERWVVDFGDAVKQPLASQPPYFNAELRKDRKVILDFSQVWNSKLDEKALQKMIKQSPFVKSIKVNFEPQSQTMSWVLEMKQEVQLQVTPVKGSSRTPAKLVVDFIR
ncbi:MAG: hypothetical protein LW875_09565 [Proteobacteria bacterium]|jgi:hypothetical protein|nr:hypothetical protein [Pseudomonadota bacterium]